MGPLTVCLAVLAVLGSAQASVFSVGHASSVARNGKIKFDNILADSDGSWNFRRSEFRCSDPGYYYISFHGLCRKNSGLTLKLVQNSAEVVRAHGDGVGYNTASNSAVVFLNSGDTISLRVADGFIHESDHLDRSFVTLSGYKVAGDGIDGGPQFGPGSGFAAAPAGGAPPEASASPEGDKEEFTPLTPDTTGPAK